VTKDALFAAVWAEAYVSEAALTVCIRELRRVLQDAVQAPQYIETVRGRGYRFVAPITETSRPLLLAGPLPLAAAPPPRLVGREAVLAQLQAHYARARQGVRQLVWVTGEAGIGKTALVDAFVAQVASADAVWVGRGQCLDQYGAGEAYLPVLEALGRLGRGPEGAALLPVLRQYAPSWLVHLPALLTPEDWERLAHTASGMTPARMLRELAEALEVLTVARPLVLVLEDLHWSDRATLEWMAYVIRRRDPACLLLLGTYRPADVMGHVHPLRPLLAELQQHPQCRCAAYASYGNLSLIRGDVVHAIVLLEHGLDLCRRWHNLDWFPECATSLGLAYSLAGRLADASPLLEQVGAQEPTMTGGSRAIYCTKLGQSYLLAGRLEEARVQAERALILAREHQERGFQAWALRLLGAVATQGHPSQVGEANTYYQQALDLAMELGMRPLQAYYHHDLRTLYATTRQWEPAHAALTTAMAMYQEMGMTRWLAQVEAALAQVEER
jgi:hypothetical protein